MGAAAADDDKNYKTTQMEWKAYRNQRKKKLTVLLFNYVNFDNDL